MNRYDEMGSNEHDSSKIRNTATYTEEKNRIS